MILYNTVTPHLTILKPLLCYKLRNVRILNNCTLIEHRQQIDEMYSQMCCALLDSSHETIPSKNDDGCRDFIVLGYNDYAEELHCEACTSYIAWKRAGSPRTGVFCSDMRTSRLRFRYALRLCKRNELSMSANLFLFYFI